VDVPVHGVFTPGAVPVKSPTKMSVAPETNANDAKTKRPAQKRFPNFIQLSFRATARDAANPPLAIPP
jgi:hypothetical protein